MKSKRNWICFISTSFFKNRYIFYGDTGTRKWLVHKNAKDLFSFFIKACFNRPFVSLFMQSLLSNFHGHQFQFDKKDLTILTSSANDSCGCYHLSVCLLKIAATLKSVTSNSVQNTDCLLWSSPKVAIYNNNFVRLTFIIHDVYWLDWGNFRIGFNIVKVD